MARCRPKAGWRVLGKGAGVGRSDRYILSQLMMLFGFFSLVLVSVYWVNRAVRLFDQLIADGQSAWVFLEFTALSLPYVNWLVLPVSAFAASYALDWRPQWWSGWPGLLLDLLILDCWIYWWHRANHVWPFLWRFHEVHHLDEFLDASSVKLNEAIDRFILGDEPFAASLQPDLYGYNEYDQLMRLDEWQARGRSDGGAA